MEKTCSVEGCGGKHYSRIGRKPGPNYCLRHFVQMKRHGKILERTQRDPNEIIVDGNVAMIVLYRKDGTRKAEAIISADDVLLVEGRKWHVDNSGTVRSNDGDKVVYLHRLVMGDPEGMEVDHINHDRLDNRRSNLRPATTSQNQMNRRFRGYHEHTQKNGPVRWRVVVRKNKRTVYERQFETEEEAARAAKEQRLIHHGEFACVN